MERYYGVITSIDPSTSTYSEAYAKKTANEFLNKLYKATKVVDSPYTYNPINILSNYSYLNNNGDNSQNRLIDNFYSGGVYAETRTPEGEVAILADKTTGKYGANITNADELSVAAVARFSDRLYLVVRPHLPYGDPINGWTRSICDIRIEHHYPYTVTPEAQEGENPPEPVTVDHKTVFHLGSNNNNGNAPAVAYEITTTYSKDTLVKLAWCPADTPSSEKELKNHFTQWDICCYGTKIEGIAGARTLAVTNGKSHTADDFGAGGPIGGFIIHRMKNGSYKYGITVFNSDGSPLYTWSDNARPWDEFDSTGEIPRNVNHARNLNNGGIGRLISKKTVSEESEETIVKMAVLAPIFCPAANDQADTAKWMPQGLYDYSYFDKTGHIYLKKTDDMADSTPVFFADHGIYLLDGGLGDYQLTDRSLPESYAINTSVVERPQPSSWLPYSGRFFAIFDSKDGLSRTGWFNTKEGGEAYDMTFVGSPTINADGSARFENNPTSQNSAWCNADYGRGNNYNRNGSIMIAVIKFNNLTAWGNATRDRDSWLAFLFGYVPSQNDRSSFNGDEYSGMSQRTYSRDSGHYNNIICDAAGSWDHYNYGRHEVTIDPDAWYIFVLSPNGTSLSTDCELYKIKSDGSTEQVSTFYYIYGYNAGGAHLTTRFYMGGYNGGDASWRTTPAQIGRVWENTQTTWATYASLEPPRISVDFKFVALSDTSNTCWHYWDNGEKNAVLTRIAQYYTGHYQPEQ